jgi:hypothetical protein
MRTGGQEAARAQVAVERVPRGGGSKPRFWRAVDEVRQTAETHKILTETIREANRYANTEAKGRCRGSER